jgi:DNA-binding protein H-NS
MLSRTGIVKKSRTLCIWEGLRGICVRQLRWLNRAEYDCKSLEIEAWIVSHHAICRNGEGKWQEGSNSLDTMSYAELAHIETRIARLKIEKQNAERAALRERILAMVREHGFEISDLFGKGRKGKGSVAVKYRDPKNPDNTWTGRGRMPRWMAAATKGGKAKKEDFLA